MSHKTAEEAIQAAKENAKLLGYVNFDGQNCDDWSDESFCAGWDGESRRCDCGNRRVYWETVKLDDGTFEAYAVAY